MSRTIIIQLSRMGDLLQTIPLVMSIRKQYPAGAAGLVCVKEFSDILKGFGLYDICIPVAADDVLKLKNMAIFDRKTIDEIKSKHGLNENYDILINCNHESGIAMLASSIKSSKKRGRLFTGPETVSARGLWAKYFFAFIRERESNLSNMSDIYVRMADLNKTERPSLPGLIRRDIEKAEKLLSDNGYDGASRIVAIHTSTSSGTRSWKAESFMKTAELLQEKLDVTILVTGSEADRDTASRICTSLKGNFINMAGKTDLSVLPALYSKCALMITNDTGPMHAANFAGTRLLVVHCCSAYFAETAPYGAGHVLVHPSIDCYPCFPSDMCEEKICIGLIPPADIANIAEHMIEGRPGRLPDFPSLSVYRTCFSNNLLSFVPETGNPPRQFVNGLTGRIIWGAVFGTENDFSYFEPALKSITSGGRILEVLSEYQSHFKRYLELTEHLLLNLKEMKIFFIKRDDAEKTRLILKEIKHLEFEFANSGFPPFSFYHQLDMDLHNDTDITDMLNIMYNRYSERKIQIRLVLGSLSQAVSVVNGGK